MGYGGALREAELSWGYEYIMAPGVSAFLCSGLGEVK